MNDTDSHPDAPRLRAIALDLRRHMVRQARGKGQGYLGQGLGIADFLAVLYWHVFDEADRVFDKQVPDLRDRQRFYLSTGHYSLALWAVLAECGVVTPEELDTYGADGSRLEMSTMEGHVPGVEMTGGSLGHGLGIAMGAALGYRLDGKTATIHVEVSDGELQEGATWEAASTAASFKLDNLVCWIDCNGIQADGPMVVSIEPVAGRFAAFGWAVREIDGNDIGQLLQTAEWAAVREGQPKAVVLRTRPGKGITRIEQRDRAHFVRIEPEEWDDVARELEQENA